MVPTPLLYLSADASASAQLIAGCQATHDTATESEVGAMQAQIAARKHSGRVQLGVIEARMATTAWQYACRESSRHRQKPTAYLLCMHAASCARVYGEDVTQRSHQKLLMCNPCCQYCLQLGVKEQQRQTQPVLCSMSKVCDGFVSSSARDWLKTCFMGCIHMA